ncbi:hypothetical protein ABB37_06273 [Leptomonas pyrrhocoris]|uniref:RING-type domain-containing protein n=1 Tax=Leptomonas pyrrhocoris TaxID=157538 RepID=A0A0M9FYN7_LEPPY|nr:hypothetical protein ABB37_06273 [Leptomonas pyrrhocoris]KPA78673.1 hypothetical protein ABB37_06273 [Leptomonas pyrrhocoris]|eukprot:XP_015657112.1 hypothetical protein ABB37_06273 [Leptomonas pyrrhocoris]
MSGLEVIALVPFGVAVWKLFQKLGDQQSLIEQHEITINSQKEMLESIVSPESRSQFTWAQTAAAMGVVGLLASIAYKSIGQEKPHSKPPPPGYEPTAATFEAEQCNICLENRKDTVFLPCRHLCACWRCALCLANGKCPTCRHDIEAMQFVYQQ